MRKLGIRNAEFGTTSWRAYLQLLRLPNVFTALADVLLGFLITQESAGDGWLLGALSATSACLYLAGMALNDVFDRDVDAMERPERPIPSGRVSLRAAKLLGWGLLAAGVSFGAIAGLLVRPSAIQTSTLAIAAALAALVVAYDAFLKRTPLGPVAMGCCRALNVLLGMSASAVVAWHPMQLWIASGLGLYVAGLTWFARQEATVSRRWQLSLAGIVMLAAIAGLSQFPRWADERLPPIMWPDYAMREPWRWNALWLAIGGLIGHRLLRAIFAPSPRDVQLAVKSAILSIVVFDAICCLGVRGAGPALTILLTLPPAMLLGRWIYST